MANCIDNVLKLFPEADREALSQVFDGMKQDARDGFLDASGNPDAEFMAKAQKRIEAYQRGVQIAEIKTLQNIAKSAKNEEFAKNEAFASRAEGVQALLTGTAKNVEGGRSSVAHQIVARNNRLAMSFLDKLRETPGAEEAYRSGALDKEILAEQWELAAGREGGVTNNEMALKIAEARQSLQAEQLLMKNDAGAFVNKLDGRLMQRVYDREKLLKVTKDEFVNKMLGWVDSDKSFKKDFHTQDGAQVLGDIYDKVTAARDSELNLDGEDSRSTLKRLDAPANLARSLERGRTIHMDSAENEYNFMKEFGAGTLADDTRRSIRQTARQTAMLDRLGTSPKLSMRELTDGLSDADKSMIDRHWKNVTGEASAPGVSPMAKWSMGARLLADVRSLGMSALSHLPNIGSRAGLIQAEGGNFFSGLAQSLEASMQNLSADQRKEFMHLTGVGADAHMGEFYDQFGTTEGGSFGYFNKAHQAFMKAFGIRWMSEMHESANAQVLSARLGYHADKAFAALDPQHANVLQKYGIGPVEWDVMRAGVGEDSGTRFIGIDSLDSVPKDKIERSMRDGGRMTLPERTATDAELLSIMKEQGFKADRIVKDESGKRTSVPLTKEEIKSGIDKFRASNDRMIDRDVAKFTRDTQTKMANYFADRSAIATGRPGAYERAAVTNRGLSEDDPLGQALRFLSQFKGYATTMATQAIPNYYHEALAGKSLGQQVATVAPLMTTMAALGYVSLAAKNAIQGKTPPTPFENGEFSPGLAAKIGTESMIHGGVGGIYADYLLGEFDSRHGRSALSAIAGPVVGQVSDAADLLTQFRNAAEEGNPAKIKASALTRFVTNNTIGNMPIIRQGLDYLFLNNMAETLNPGYTERMRARLEKQGQSTWAPWAQ